MIEKLPKDNQILLVVNCTQTWEEVERERAYICPAQSGPYNHRPSRYFGVYHNKSVSTVANIEAAIDVNADESVTVRWISGLDTQDNYRRRAIEFAKRLRPKNEFPVRVLILGYPQATDFRRDGRGGMVGSTQYFDVTNQEVDSAGELAQKLRGKNWSSLKAVEHKTTSSSSDEAGSPGKYDPLRQWFLQVPESKTRLQLSFSKIEEIINDRLPPSARQYTAWWLDKSDNTSHIHAFAWLDSGWGVENLELPTEEVSFVKS